MRELSDDALLAAYVQGDKVAARVLTLRLTPQVFARAMTLLKNRTEAEDVTQEAMLRLWRIAPDWRAGEAKITTWLWQVTTNLCTDRLRRSGRTRPLDDAGDPVDPAVSAEMSMLNSARAEALKNALADLPERQRRAVQMRHIDGMGNAQIALALDTSTEAVESLTARGCRALKAALAGRRADLGFTDDEE
ncbi:sigma-70 family RNA polymerase sigma factor [Primorskyibacter sp. S187A]|uniref:sigma-70 family RNA polymerase sigma factor n=1 Tax=Primorskyibacter sp. S187A TaxID=3415130 RepID=UPI003C7C37C3